MPVTHPAALTPSPWQGEIRRGDGSTAWEEIDAFSRASSRMTAEYT